MFVSVEESLNWHTTGLWKSLPWDVVGDKKFMLAKKKKKATAGLEIKKFIQGN